MKPNRKTGSAGRREHRAFSTEFKAEAVRLVADRRASGVTLAQVGRELDVRSDQLRAWAREQRGDPDAGTSPPAETLAGKPSIAARARGRAAGAGLREKNGGVVRGRVAVRYAVITRHRCEFQVRLMCRVLEVSPSRYDSSVQRPASWHAITDEVLMAHVRMAHRESGASRDSWYEAAVGPPR